MEDVARSLRPAPRIQALVDRIVSGLSADGPFNGVHLRLEDDARYQDLMGGQEVRFPGLKTLPLKNDVRMLVRLSSSGSLLGTVLSHSVPQVTPVANPCLFTQNKLPTCAFRRMQAVWRAYFEAAKYAGFDNSTTLYVASGLLTYMNTSGEAPWCPELWSGLVA